MILEKNFSLPEARPYIDELKEEINKVVETLNLDTFIKVKGFDQKIRVKSKNPEYNWEPVPRFAFKNKKIIKNILEIAFKEAIEDMATKSMYHDEDEVWVINIDTGWSHGSQIYSVRTDQVFETGMYTIKFRQLAYGDRDEFGLPFDVFEIVPRIGARNHNVVGCIIDQWCVPA